MSDSDAELMARTKRGDRAAFRVLYERHEGRVYAYLWRLLGDRGRAEDLRQEVFVRLWTARQGWRAGGTVAGFLIRTARNLALNEQRHAQVERRWRGRVAGERLPSPPTPDVVLERSDLAARVHSAIEALPDRPREVFILKRDAGMTYREIAEQLGISPRTVEVHMSRAYKLLRAALGPAEGGSDSG